MHGIAAKDGDRTIDWSKSAADYATWRPGYPPSFYDRLAALGVGGRPGQRILDLGTGTGLVALELARRGARVVGIDVAAGQLEEASRTARTEGLDAQFLEAPAEATGQPSAEFDVVTASQCWTYFDKARVIPEVKRLLKPGGLLVTCHLCWLPRLDAIAQATEQLVLQHNPDWTAADWSGIIPPMPAWAEGHFELAAMFAYDVPMPFTAPQWRGRIRACRAIGPTLTPEQVADFDAQHEALLAAKAGDRFTILHRIDAHFLRPL